MTIEQLTEQLRERDAAIAELRSTNAELQSNCTGLASTNAELKSTNSDLQAVNAELTEAVGKLRGELEWCKRQLFGRKSERYEDPNQPKLFDAAMVPAGDDDASSNSSGDSEGESGGDSEPAAVTVPSHQRREGRRGKREPIPDHLRREQIVHELPADERIDPTTGEPLLIKIGEEVSEKLAFKPGEVYVERHVRIKYRRANYENLGDSNDSPSEIVIAPPPNEGLPKSIAAPTLLAEIGVRKFADHQPLHRLVKILGRNNVKLAKSSMCRWMQDLDPMFRPLLGLMKWLMLKYSLIIGHDDTPVRQQAPGKGRCDTCRFWTAIGQPGTQGYYVLFDYTQNRSRAGPERWFREPGGDDGQPLFVEGDLLCDAYAGYGSAGNGGLLDPNGPWRMTHVGCWAHARRKFHDARLSAPAEACRAMGMIRQLYEIERRLKDMPPEHRCEIRQAEAKPKVDTFFAWCADQQSRMLPRSAIGEAVTYALNQQTSLRRYLEAGHRPIDNNACERSLRGLAIGRKNWLFTGSEAGGHAAAAMFSLIASAHLHHIEPRAYLHALIRHLPATPNDQLHHFLPDRWAENNPNT